MPDTKTVTQELHGRTKGPVSASSAVSASALEDVAPLLDAVLMFRYREVAFPAPILWQNLVKQLHTSGPRPRGELKPAAAARREVPVPPVVPVPDAIAPISAAPAAVQDDLPVQKGADLLEDFWQLADTTIQAPAVAVPSLPDPPAPAVAPVPAVPLMEPPQVAAPPSPAAPTPQVWHQPEPAPALIEPYTETTEASERRSFLASIPVSVAVCAGLLALGVPVFQLANKSSMARELATVTAESAIQGSVTTMGEDGWKTEWASDPVGSSRGRQLTLYRPSASLSNYRFEFSGQIQNGSLGWVFRAADSRNYYLAKLEASGNGPVQSIDFVRYSVVDGRQSPSLRKTLRAPFRKDAVFNVRLDAQGPSFTLFVNGEPVEMWNDHQLVRGAIGFSNERLETGVIQQVRMNLLGGRDKR